MIFGLLDLCTNIFVEQEAKFRGVIIFGSEFIAMKQCCEYVHGLRYKLRMMGISCDNPTFIYEDNQSVLANTTIPDSTLKKKSQSIAYHFVQEGAAWDEW